MTIWSICLSTCSHQYVVTTSSHWWSLVINVSTSFKRNTSKMTGNQTGKPTCRRPSWPNCSFGGLSRYGMLCDMSVLDMQHHATYQYFPTISRHAFTKVSDQFPTSECSAAEHTASKSGTLHNCVLSRWQDWESNPKCCCQYQNRVWTCGALITPKHDTW